MEPNEFKLAAAAWARVLTRQGVEFDEAMNACADVIASRTSGNWTPVPVGDVVAAAKRNRASAERARRDEARAIESLETARSRDEIAERIAGSGLTPSEWFARAVRDE